MPWILAPPPAPPFAGLGKGNASLPSPPVYDIEYRDIRVTLTHFFYIKTTIIFFSKTISFF